MSQRVTEVPPYDTEMYQGISMDTRWKGWFLGLDKAVNGNQGAPATVSGASPYTLQNTTSCDQLVMVAGGTVSSVEYSRDGSTFITTGSVTGQFVVFPGDYLRVTYSVAPTITVVSK